jgi:hypothetical protein
MTIQPSTALPRILLLFSSFLSIVFLLPLSFQSLVNHSVITTLSAFSQPEFPPFFGPNSALFQANDLGELRLPPAWLATCLLLGCCAAIRAA